MYPYLRAAFHTLAARRMAPLRPGETHVVRTRVMPWDIDMFMELNNGRSLTLMDLGRMPTAVRGGLWDALRRERWRLTVAGVSVQYRKRIPPFAKIEIRTRAVGRDAKFIYIEHVTMLGGTPAQQAAYRVAVADRNGLVRSDRVAAAMGNPDWNPPLPPWIAAWAEAEALRPWPPALGAAEIPPPPDDDAAPATRAAE